MLDYVLIIRNVEEYKEIEDQAAFLELAKSKMSKEVRELFFPEVKEKPLESYRIIFIDGDDYNGQPNIQYTSNRCDHVWYEATLMDSVQGKLTCKKCGDVKYV